MKSKNQVYTEIEIHATREQVWSVLTDFEKLSDWSSSFQNLIVEGSFETGVKATSYYKSPIPGHELKFEHHLIEVVQGVSFGWSDPLGFAGMTDHHIFKLETLDNGHTKFVQTDGVTGGASRFLGHLVANNMEGQYRKFNQELKARVESLFPKYSLQ